MSDEQIYFNNKTHDRLSELEASSASHTEKIDSLDLEKKLKIDYMLKMNQLVENDKAHQAMHDKAFKEIAELREKTNNYTEMALHMTDAYHKLDGDIGKAFEFNSHERSKLRCQLNELKEQLDTHDNMWHLTPSMWSDHEKAFWSWQNEHMRLIKINREVLRELGKVIVSAFVILQVPDNRIESIEKELAKLDSGGEKVRSATHTEYECISCDRPMKKGEICPICKPPEPKYQDVYDPVTRITNRIQIEPREDDFDFIDSRVVVKREDLQRWHDIFDLPYAEFKHPDGRFESTYIEEAYGID